MATPPAAELVAFLPNILPDGPRQRGSKGSVHVPPGALPDIQEAQTAEAPGQEHPAVNKLEDGGAFYEVLQKLVTAHELALAQARGEAPTFALEMSPCQSIRSKLNTLDIPPAPASSRKTNSSRNSSSRYSTESAAVRVNSAEEFKVFGPWKTDADRPGSQYRSSWLSSRSKLDGSSCVLQDNMDNLIVGSSWLQFLLIHPSSFKLLAWDLVSMFFLIYDIIMIPFVGAFNPQAVPFTITMNYTTMFFWTLDMGMSMIIGYQDGRETVLEPTRILKRYLKTWFWLDSFIVGLDWTLLFVGQSDSGGSAARLGRSLRTLRFVRTLRLMRLLKVKRILQEIQDQINTETISICFRILKIIFVLVLANHVVACAWYGIGQLNAEQNDGFSTWVITNDMEGRTLTYKYATSLHWSLTQFTPASMEVVPQNVQERLFSVVVLLFAMITFSSFVSMLTASMGELRNISSDEARQFWLLRRYLRDWGVNRRFSLRLQRYLEYAYHKQRQRVQAKDVKLLALLSGPLHDELRAKTSCVHLVTHPLFQQCDRYLRVFSKSLTDIYFGRGDCAFSCGEQGSTMIFVSAGVFSYQLGELLSDCVHAPTGRQQEVGEGQWVAEAVLWTSWLHQGDLLALSEAQVISIDSHQFSETVQVFRPLWVAFRAYARHFVQAMNQIDQRELTDLLHTALSPQTIVDSAGIMGRHSTHAVEENQEPTLFRFGRSVWNGLSAPCTWLFVRRDPVVKQREFGGSILSHNMIRRSTSPTED